MILMTFSNFYKQRVMPSEFYEFFCNNQKNVEDYSIDANLDYIITKPSEDLEKEISKLKEISNKAKKKRRIQFADNIQVEEIKDSTDGKFRFPDVDPIVQI